MDWLPSLDIIAALNRFTVQSFCSSTTLFKKVVAEQIWSIKAA
jgi:hypothetical protein